MNHGVPAYLKLRRRPSSPLRYKYSYATFINKYLSETDLRPSRIAESNRHERRNLFPCKKRHRCGTR